MPRMVDPLEIGPNTLKLLRERYELHTNSPTMDADGFENYVRRFIQRDIKPLVRKIWMEAKVQGKGTPYLQKLYLDVLTTFIEEERARAELTAAIAAAEKREDSRKTREKIQDLSKGINENTRAIRKMQEEERE